MHTHATKEGDFPLALNLFCKAKACSASQSTGKSTAVVAQTRKYIKPIGGKPKKSKRTHSSSAGAYEHNYGQVHCVHNEVCI